MHQFRNGGWIFQQKTSHWPWPGLPEIFIKKLKYKNKSIFFNYSIVNLFHVLLTIRFRYWRVLLPFLYLEQLYTLCMIMTSSMKLFQELHSLILGVQYDLDYCSFWGWSSGPRKSCNNRGTAIIEVLDLTWGSFWNWKHESHCRLSIHTYINTKNNGIVFNNGCFPKIL